MDTSRCLHPRTKNFACSSDQATARASPSVGEYLVSAGNVNRDPANTNFQPSLQQIGALAISQWQCCWGSRYLYLL